MRVNDIQDPNSADAEAEEMDNPLKTMSAMSAMSTSSLKSDVQRTLI